MNQSLTRSKWFSWDARHFAHRHGLCICGETGTANGLLTENDRSHADSASPIALHKAAIKSLRM